MVNVAGHDGSSCAGETVEVADVRDLTLVVRGDQHEPSSEGGL